MNFSCLVVLDGGAASFRGLEQVLYRNSHVWKSHVMHMNESCHTYVWVMSRCARRWCSFLLRPGTGSLRVWHICMSHVTPVIESFHTCKESCHAYRWVVSRTWMSHVTHMTESCHAYEWVMSHIWMGCITRMNESCLAYEWVMSHTWISHVAHMNASSHDAR